MRHTPLHALQQSTGARWANLDGWSMVMDYGDAAAEYTALDRGAALVDLSFRGKVRLTGPDRAAFLHNLVTNDVVSLRPGQGCNAAKLTVQGKYTYNLKAKRITALDPIAPTLHAEPELHLEDAAGKLA